MSKTMAEVLAEHQWYDATSDNEDPATGCTGCDDWFGSEDALDDGTFAAHQAAALSAAGFGLVADTKAERASAMQEAMRIAWEQGRNAVWAFMSNTDPRRERPTNPYRNPS